MPMESTTDQLPPLDSLKCALCANYFDDPLTLSCMHSFCTSCLLKKHDAHDLDEFLAPLAAAPLSAIPEGKHNPNEPTAQTAAALPPPRKRLVCPTCVEVLGLDPPEDPTEPFKNARLARIVKLVHDTPVLCENCKQSESEKLCTVCDVHCCERCWKMTHSAPIFCKHEGKPLTHSEMCALPKCPHHVLNEQEFFVTDEEVGVCQVCLLKGDYVGAAYALVNDVRNERQGEIELSLQDVAGQRERILEGKEQTSATLEELESNHILGIKAVRENFAAIRDALDKREIETLDALEELKKAKRGVLEDQVEQAKIAISQIEDGIHNVELVLKHSNPLEIIYQTYVIGEHLNTIGNVPNTAPRVCSQCQSDSASCHHPGVDANLPVLLSDRVPSIVMAYAAVPNSQWVHDVAHGIMLDTVIAPQASDEQKQVMKQIAASAGSADQDFGCVLM